MNFLIDKEIWRKVLIKLPPETAILLKEGLKPDLNGWDSKIKREFVLSLSNEEIDCGFFISNCVNNRHIIYDSIQIHCIEKAIIEVLIENQGLSKEVKYRTESNIRPRRNEQFIDFKIFNFIVCLSLSILFTLLLPSPYSSITFILAIAINIIWFLLSIGAL